MKLHEIISNNIGIDIVEVHKPDGTGYMVKVRDVDRQLEVIRHELDTWGNMNVLAIWI